MLKKHFYSLLYFHYFDVEKNVKNYTLKMIELITKTHGCWQYFCLISYSKKKSKRADALCRVRFSRTIQMNCGIT